MLSDDDASGSVPPDPLTAPPDPETSSGKDSTVTPTEIPPPKHKKRAGGRKRWTTEDQGQYLESHIPRIQKAKRDKKLKEQWPDIQYGWFQRWPLKPPSADQLLAGETEQMLRDVQMLVSRSFIHKITTHSLFLAVY